MHKQLTHIILSNTFFITQVIASFPIEVMCYMSQFVGPRGNRQLHFDLDFKDSFLPLLLYYYIYFHTW